jgi:ADP-ribosyl-[dinitrogen reductase] hydrolase
MSSDAASLQDRAAGALLGLAVGDAVGTTLEFARRDAQPPVTDMVGGGPFSLKPGEWTDDTAMAIALGNSLAECDHFNPRDCINRFVNWYRRGMYSCTGTCFDIGMATRQALERFIDSDEPFSGSTNPGHAGNGSLMRLSPVAIWGIRHSDDEIMRVARDQSRTTHGAPECLTACEAYAVMTARAIRGDDRSAIFAAPTTITPPSERLAGIFAGEWRGQPRANIESSGYVVDSIEAALWCVDQTGNFEAAILLAANLADDADTVAAITGQLAGAIYGASGIPKGWLERLAWRDEIEQLALRLLD